MASKHPFRKYNSGSIARRRLELVLISDETQIQPGCLELIRSDLIDVISRYAEFDTARVTIRLTHTGEDTALAAEIPIGPFVVLRKE